MDIKRCALPMLTAVCLSLAACSEVDYSELHENISSSQSTEVSLPENSDENSGSASMYTEHLKTEFEVKETPLSITFETEKDYSGEVFKTLGGFTGDGYISIAPTESFTLEFTAPETQFYSVTVNAASNGAMVTLISGGDKLITAENGRYERLNGVLHGSYNLPENDEFCDYTLNTLYLKKGLNRLTFQAVRGVAHIDSVTIKNDRALRDTRYSDVMTSLSGSEADYIRISLMNYLKSIYGRYTLTAQYVTPGTDVETEVIALNTGRYPAVRFSDLCYCTENAKKHFGIGGDDISLACEYAKNGGIIGYSWYWYSPYGDPTFMASETDIDISDVLPDDVKDLAVLSGEELDLLLENGRISEDCVRLLDDMDSIAAELKRLKDDGVAVLFRPLPQSGSGWYWWETDPDGYIKLWRTLHRRFEELHGLSNIIWVYSHANEDMFPGDEYIDIIGCDFYNSSPSSGVCEMLGTDKITVNPRMLALTECEYTPSPDIMYRDKAMWLWTGALSGGYLVNDRGELHGNYISVDELKRVYNHELTLARDEVKIED